MINSLKNVSYLYSNPIIVHVLPYFATTVYYSC